MCLYSIYHNKVDVGLVMKIREGEIGLKQGFSFIVHL